MDVLEKLWERGVNTFINNSDSRQDMQVSVTV